MKTIAAVLALAALSCEATPEKTFGTMKKAACAGDSATVFDHIDKPTLADNVAKGIVRDAAKDPKKKAGAAMIEAIAPAAARKAIEEWEDDIKRGEGSDMCKMTFSSAGPLGGSPRTGVVYWDSASGNKKGWQFTEYGKKWMVTDMW